MEDNSRRSHHSCDEGQWCASERSPLWYCATCESHFCENCWDRTVAHRPKKGREIYQLPHEKTNEHIVKRLERILHPPNDEATLLKLHEDDEQSTWFGE